jgi:integrase
VPILERIMARGNLRSAELVRKMIGSIFDYAIGKLIIERGTNPARSLSGFVNPPKPVHHPKLTPAELPAFLSAIDSLETEKRTKIALKLLMHLFTRKGELTNARWPEFDLDGGLWRIPPTRMKGKVEHLVPLSPQVVAMFLELKELAGDSDLVFPGQGGRKPIHRGLLNVAIDRMGYKGRFSPHGTRSTAATILSEAGWDSDVVDRQLSHIERDQVKGSYIRPEFIEERKRLMAAWSDMLDGYASGAKVIPFKQAKTAGAT